MAFQSTAQVTSRRDDDVTMDILYAPPGTERAADELLGNPHDVRQILSSIISHQSLSSTLQRIADAFVAQCPAKGIAIFLLSGSRFQLEAEAGLPQRPQGDVDWTAAFESRESPTRDLPALRQILDSGVSLCSATPLFSGSGEGRGAVIIFDRQQGALDDSMRDNIRNLSELARLAIDHCQLYQEVVHAARHDRLTGLPNRLLLEDRLRQAMVLAKQQGTLVAVCCFDLDGFKQINNSVGHELGDGFFKLVSERLRQSIREMDTLARPAGEDFILVLRDLADTSEAGTICRRLLKELSAPYLLNGHSLTITAGIGISVFPQHGDTPDLLLRNADMAVQAAKRDGSGQVQIYSPALGRQTRRAAEMVEALVNALALEQFRMVYQPIFSMDQEIVGFEALLRWQHPAWGLLSPLEFIPTAERSGLIVAIGDWVIDEVCRQAVEWKTAAICPVKMFANVSGVQLERPDFSSKIADALKRTGLAPGCLELEITESWVISDLHTTATKLQQLRDLGIGIAIDDFGTGHATFNYLQQLPLDTLKIDRSFIHRLEGSAATRSTVRAITSLAQQLGLKTVAEGVESEQQIRQLREIGCEFMQGFFLARPLEPEAAGSLLSKQQCASLRAELARERAVNISSTRFRTG